MHAISVPQNVETYVEEFHERALPDSSITDNDFYRRLIGWVLDTRAPIIYAQDHPDEYTNFSINFNWLLVRDYSNTRLGPADTIKTMYSLHECVHMTQGLPTRLDDIAAAEYAEAFARSEYRASNETELLIHYRIPELRPRVFPGTKIAYDMLEEKGVEQPSADLLCALRPLVVEHTVLDPLFEGSDEDREIGARFKRYKDNRGWATERFSTIQPFFSGNQFPRSSGLTDNNYESVIGAYEPSMDQTRYEEHTIRNVRFGYAMCGLALPNISSFNEARRAAVQLEGQHAIVQS